MGPFQLQMFYDTKWIFKSLGVKALAMLQAIGFSWSGKTTSNHNQENIERTRPAW